MDKDKFMAELAANQFLVKAILEDYVQLASKYEGVKPEVVEARIKTKAQSFLNNFKKSQR